MGNIYHRIYLIILVAVTLPSLARCSTESEYSLNSADLLIYTESNSKRIY